MRGVRSAADAAATEARRMREQLARRLFNEWTGVTHPEIRSVLWHNLSAGDRRHWCDLADEHLSTQIGADK